MLLNPADTQFGLGLRQSGRLIVPESLLPDLRADMVSNLQHVLLLHYTALKCGCCYLRDMDKI